MRLIIMILTLLVVLLGVNFYIFFRLWHLIPVFPAGRIILGILSLLVATLLTVGNVNYHNKKRVELAIKTDKNIDRPLKIVAIADLHLGYGTGTKEFRKWVKLINREEPDIVLIVGDAIDNSLKPLYERNFTAVFSEIKTKQGIYLAPGNHEYISNITKSIDFLTKAGVTVLKDSVALVNNTCYIAGRDDRSNSERKTIWGGKFRIGSRSEYVVINIE